MRGRIGYEAYGETAGWKTFDGRPMPTWDELSVTDVGQETQRRWEIAAEAVLANNPRPFDANREALIALALDGGNE